MTNIQIPRSHISRVAVGMGIPIPMGMGIWFSPVGIPIWISIWGSIRGYPYGIPTGENHIPILNPIPWLWGIHMGISVWISIRISQYGSPYPWNCVENRNMILSCGDLHMGIYIWGSPWGFPMKSCGNGMRVGVEKFRNSRSELQCWTQCLLIFWSKNLKSITYSSITWHGCHPGWRIHVAGLSLCTTVFVIISGVASSRLLVPHPWCISFSRCCGVLSLYLIAHIWVNMMLAKNSFVLTVSLYNLCRHQKEFGLQADWDFFATSHG